MNSPFLFQLQDLGLIDYQKGLNLQRKTVQEVIQGGNNTILLCEHPPVFTLGRLAAENNFFIPQQQITEQGIQIVRIDRGGEVTLHSPGQLVTYPIFNLNHFGRDLKVFLHKLEQVAIDLLQDFDIVAHRILGQRGVWVGKDKIASIGIGVKKWVSFHGMAVNVNTDLDLFSLIRPCGLDVKMTSISRIKNQLIDMDDVKKRMIKCFCDQFNLNELPSIKKNSKLLSGDTDVGEQFRVVKEKLNKEEERNVVR